LALVAGLVAVGFGGYNFISTGCPLGHCGGGDSDAALTSVSVPATNAASPMGGECPHSACAAETVVQTAAIEGSPKACCEGKAKGEGCCGLCTEGDKASTEVKPAGEAPVPTTQPT